MRIACIQLNSRNDMEANVAVIREHITRAAADGAALALLPENACCMPASHAELLAYAFPEATHPALAAIRECAAQRGIGVLIGSLAIPAEGTAEGRCYNRSYLIAGNGDIAARYDKIHLFDVTLPDGTEYAESRRYVAGQTPVVTETPWGRIGLSICYDVRFPHLYRYLAQHGAAMLTVPAAFTATTGPLHWETLLRARAIETGCYVLAPAQCGVHADGRATHGHSLMIDPWGSILADGGEAPGMMSADIEIGEVMRYRASIPSLADQHFIYEGKDG